MDDLNDRDINRNQKPTSIFWGLVDSLLCVGVVGFAFCVVLAVLKLIVYVLSF